MHVFRLGEIEIDLDRREARRPDRVETLTSSEVSLLRYLAQRPGEVVSRAELGREVWGHHPDTRSRAVHHTVTRLRRKLEEAPNRPRFLCTVRGAGYRLVIATGPGARGRTSELRRLAELLERHRWITIVGQAGIGKTWLARTWLQDHPGTFCDLSHAEGPRALALGVGEALGMSPSTLGREPVRAIERALLFRGPTLLVLDNLEQCAGAEQVLRRWAQQGAHLRLLCTSRSALADEPCLEIAPMPEDAAIALFCDVAAQVRPGWRAGPAELSGIVAQLDGVPLALELAAATLDVLDLDQLRRKLSDPVHALGGLRQSLASSWALLDPPSRGTLAAACVLEAPCTADILGAIAQVDPVPVLRGLARASMIARVEGPRFWVRPLVRAFVLSQLPPDERERLCAAAVDWFLERLDGWIGRELATGRCPVLLATRRSLMVLSERASTDERRARLLIGAYYGVERHGPLQTWIDAVDRVPYTALSGRTPAELSWQHANGLRLAGDRLGAVARAREGLALEPEPDLAARLLLVIGACQTDGGQQDQALQTYAESLRLAPRGLLPQVRSHLAIACYRRWELEEAFQHAQAAHDAFQARGHDRFAAICLNTMGLIRWREGDLGSAEATFQAAVALHEATRSALMLAASLDNLGLVAHEAGRFDQARAHYERALAMHRSQGGIYGTMICLGNLGDLHLEEGRLDEARDTLIEALALAEIESIPRSIASILGSLGDVARASDDLQGARTYWSRGLGALGEIRDDVHEALVQRLGSTGGVRA